METFLVGGAVRDELLGLPVRERDWVVVGGRAEQLLEQGYLQVGKDFPVFLHPQTKEEYALARLERKTGPGHLGFECDAGEQVTLEQDLERRDLTINAIAKTPGGDLVDPYNGKEDLESRVLRHVSAAFSEDPLRILRLARFYARFEDFAVAAETVALARQMVAEAQLAELPAERIWQETEKALAVAAPERFFQLLESLGANQSLWPEISESCIVHLAAISKLSINTEMRLAYSLFQLSPLDVKNCLLRIKAPNRYIDLAVATARHLSDFFAEPADPETIVDVLYETDAFRRTDRFTELCQIANLHAQMTNLEIQVDWQRALQVANQISIHDIPGGLKGPAIGSEIKAKRVTAMAKELN